MGTIGALGPQVALGKGPELKFVRQKVVPKLPKPTLDGLLDDSGCGVDWANDFTALPFFKAPTKEHLVKEIVRDAGGLSVQAMQEIYEAFLIQGLTIAVYALEALFFDELRLVEKFQVRSGGRIAA